MAPRTKRKEPQYIKSRQEIKKLYRAATITRDIFRRTSKLIKPGVRESEIRDEVERIIRKKRLRRSFTTIVASGPNASKPHAKVTGRKIKKNDIVVLDFGVIYKGYHSDMTRTITLGKTPPKIRRLYNTVREAQKTAIRKIRPGIRISDLVKGINDYMAKKGFGKYILHSLGHGIGRRVHEPPKLSVKNRRILKKNTVVTVEPGLYITKRCGVRIEDMVLIGERTHEVLTR